jgi:hypothetical protein
MQFDKFVMGNNALYLAQKCADQRGIGLLGSRKTTNRWIINIIIIKNKLQQYKNNSMGNIIELYVYTHDCAFIRSFIHTIPSKKDGRGFLQI